MDSSVEYTVEGGASDTEGYLSAGDQSFRPHEDPVGEDAIVSLAKCMEPEPDARQLCDIRKHVGFLKSTSSLLRGVAYG